MEIQWSLVLFTVVAGAGAWQFAAAMIEALAKKDELPCRAESIVAFVLLVVGGCLSVTHLKHVDRILEALNHPASGIFVEAAHDRRHLRAHRGVLHPAGAQVLEGRACGRWPGGGHRGRRVHLRLRRLLHDGCPLCVVHAGAPHRLRPDCGRRGLRGESAREGGAQARGSRYWVRRAADRHRRRCRCGGSRRCSCWARAEIAAAVAGPGWCCCS